MHGLELVQDLAVVLVVAGAAAWFCQRIGVSVVVGYLLAGIVVGPFTPPTSLVSGLESVHHLANLGLIFVMFFVGLELSLPRLKALGLPVVAVTVSTALLVLAASRATAGALGLGVTGGLFLGGILVVSSSAIIDKVFNELDISRERPSQLAMGITVLEDVVAVVMLAVLGSLAAASAQEAPPVWRVLGALAAFVVVSLLLSLLVAPRLLRALRRTASPDVQAVCVAGLLLAGAWVAARAGYSIALGAFLLGTALGGTRHKQGLEHAFSTVRDLFAAVFFVSMGMLFDVGLVATEWPWVLALAGFALLTRGLAAFAGLLAVGQPLGTATQVSLSLLPLGEFSFVIAQLGVSSGLMPPAFYPATVGAALITTLLSPPLIRRGPPAGRWLQAREPALLRAWRSVLEGAGEALARRRHQQPMLRLVGGRLLQLTLEIAVVVSAVASSRLLFEALDGALRGSAVQRWLPYLYWAGFGAVLLVPLLALWRGLGALGMILGEAASEGGGGASRARVAPVIEKAVQVGGALGLLLLCAAFLPGWAARPAVLLAIAALGAALALLLRPQLVRWHAQARSELRGNLGDASAPGTGAVPAEAVRLLPAGAPLGLRLHEHTLSDLSPAAGRTVGETELRRRTGCTLVGVGRQGISLPAPGADLRLFPNDRLLLAGTSEQIAAAENWLALESPEVSGGGFEELVTESLRVPEGSARAGRTVGELAIASHFGAQVLAVCRDGRPLAAAIGDVALTPGDVLFVLGSARQNQELRAFLAE